MARTKFIDRLIYLFVSIIVWQASGALAGNEQSLSAAYCESKSSGVTWILRVEASTATVVLRDTSEHSQIVSKARGLKLPNASQLDTLKAVIVDDCGPIALPTFPTKPDELATCSGKLVSMHFSSSQGGFTVPVAANRSDDAKIFMSSLGEGDQGYFMLGLAMPVAVQGGRLDILHLIEGRKNCQFD